MWPVRYSSWLKAIDVAKGDLPDGQDNEAQHTDSEAQLANGTC